MDTTELDAVVETISTIMEDSPVVKVVVNLTLVFENGKIDIIQEEIRQINRDVLVNGKTQQEKEKKKTKDEETEGST